MSCICRTCLSGITSNRYVDINLSEFARKQLKLCIPELDLDLVLEPVLCLECVEALNAAYDFKSCCLQTEQRIKAHVETLTIEQQHVELDAVLGNNDNEINSMAIHCGNDITNDLNTVHDHSRTRRDLEDYKDAKGECSITSENCSETLFDDGVEVNYDSFKEESIKIEEHEWDNFIKSEMFDTSVDPEGLPRQCNKLDAVNYNANNENCNSATISAELCTKQGNSVTKSQVGVVSMEPNNSSSGDIINNHCIKRSLKSISSIERHSTTNNCCKCANRQMRCGCRQKEENIEEQIVAKSELDSELLRERKMVLGVGPLVKKSSLRCDKNIKSNNTAATEAEADVNSVIDHSQLHLEHSNTSALNNSNTNVSLEHSINSNNLSVQVKNEELSTSSHFLNTIGKNAYKCDQCDYVSYHKGTLNRHKKKHSGEKPYKCGQCDYACSRKDMLMVHIRKHIGEKPYKCKQCDYAFSRKDKLIIHMRMHTGEKSFKCGQCDYTCYIKSSLKLHIRNHSLEKPYKCNVCNYASSKRAVFNIHLRTHTGEKPYKCDQCDYACSQKNSLNLHIRIHTGEKPYKCGQCDYASSNKSDLNDHLRTHTGEKPYKCGLCDYACSQKSNLRIHIRNHTGENPYRCDQCDYTSFKKSCLNSHLWTHTGEKPYKCGHCIYACSRKDNLIVHIRNHTGDKPYNCNVCNYAYSHKSNLITHIRNHTGDKPYKCNVCNYAYSHKSNLITHIRNHSGDKPYKYDQCDYASAQSSQLIRHMKKHSGEKPY